MEASSEWPIAAWLLRILVTILGAMSFWGGVLATVTGAVLASVLLGALYAALQWFLRATDIKIGYGWKWQGPKSHPSFDVRNRSSSRTYLLGNIKYTRNSGRDVVWFDNKSIWSKELKPGSINYFDDIASVPGVTSAAQCTDVEVTIRLQSGREFWLKGQRPGQLQKGRAQRAAFWLRDKIERSAIPVER